jgi:hypothetical protein
MTFQMLWIAGVAQRSKRAPSGDRGGSQLTYNPPPRPLGRLLRANHYSWLAVERLDELEPEERNRIYKMLDRTVGAHENGKRRA